MAYDSAIVHLVFSLDLTAQFISIILHSAQGTTPFYTCPPVQHVFAIEQARISIVPARLRVVALLLLPFSSCGLLLPRSALRTTSLRPTLTAHDTIDCQASWTAMLVTIATGNASVATSTIRTIYHHANHLPTAVLSHTPSTNPNRHFQCISSLASTLSKVKVEILFVLPHSQTGGARMVQMGLPGVLIAAR